MRANIKRVRDDRGMSQNELSETLRELGRPIPPLGIHRIENGDRRVDVDDLVAIAVALEVSPTTFLLPNSQDSEDSVTATGLSHTYPAKALWDWMRIDHFVERSANGIDQLKFIQRAAPGWRSVQYAEGVLQLLELDRIKADMDAGGEPAVAARQRLAELRKEYWVSDGDDQ